MWIFGYGSLVWKTDFPYQQRVVGYIKGYVRRFWQASVDHRGVPEKPGRVVTLVPAGSEDCVWGVAYKINGDLLEKNSSLNIREKSYQERKLVEVYTKGGTKLEEPALVFLGTSQPDLMLGPAKLEDMAEQIASAVGPSGMNSQYLLKLAHFMHNEVPSDHTDKHLFELETEVNKILKERRNPS